MKKNIIIVFMLAFMVTTTYSEDSGFRNYLWGVPIDNVKKNEENILISETENILIYESSLGSYLCNVFYFFNEDRLYSGMYSIESSHNNENKLADNYRNFNKILCEKYGRTFKDESEWLHLFFENHIDRNGFTYDDAHVIYSSSWRKSGTYISNVFARYNMKIFQFVYYKSEEIQIIEKDNMDFRDKL